jgi:PAS domain S-box-containing protein
MDPSAETRSSTAPSDRKALAALPVPVLITRRSDDTILYANPAYTATYGFDSAKIVGMPAGDVHFVPRDRSVALSTLGATPALAAEVRLKGEDETCRWAEAHVSEIDADGERAAITVFYDIGTRKEAERELARYVADMEEVARFPEMNPGPVARVELDGTVYRANTAAARIFGHESLQGLSWLELCPELNDELWSTIVDGRRVTHVAALGDTVLSITMARDPEGDQVFVYGTDVTEQKRAERELADLARFPEMNPGPVVRLGGDGTVKLANTAARRLFDCQILQGRAGGDPIHHHVEIGDRHLDFTIAKDPGSDQVFAYGGDVTELKQAEKVIAEMARFPEMNPGPVCRLDRTGCIRLANRAARSLFGSEDLKGQNWLDLCVGIDEAFWNRVLAADDWVPFETKIGDRHFVLTHTPPDGDNVFVYGTDITDEKAAERALRQSEKMATLGTLAAGVAHELNNPAAAAQRAAEQLQNVFGELQEAQIGLRSLELTPEQRSYLEGLDRRAREAATCPCDLDALARSDREAELEDWLEDRGVEEAWELAPTMVNMNLTEADLAEIADHVGVGNLGTVSKWLCCAYQVYGLLDEIRHGAGRLSEIVGALKSYSYLDRAPVQNVNVNDGLRNTLIILRSKLKEGIVVDQQLDPGLPRIEAYGSELNQVWTNLIDNAVDAMDGSGRIVLRTFPAESGVVIEVEDEGPGIPPDVQTRIYDAFFTTKAPGKGTGLGLNTVYNIVVKKHGGRIALDSVPGRTCFRVELPHSLGDGGRSGNGPGAET